MKRQFQPENISFSRPELPNSYRALDGLWLGETLVALLPTNINNPPSIVGEYVPFKDSVLYNKYRKCEDVEWRWLVSG